MFTTARYFIKTSFTFFIIGMLSGLYLYSGHIFGWYIPRNLISAHTHILLIGGMIMMILGVAIWFFPRPKKDDTRYNPQRILFFYWTFTLSTLLRFIFEILDGINETKTVVIIAYTCSIVQVFSIIALIYSVWGRIRPVGSQLREKEGERF